MQYVLVGCGRDVGKVLLVSIFDDARRELYIWDTGGHVQLAWSLSCRENARMSAVYFSYPCSQIFHEHG